nr:mammalian cell entry protein [Actinomycetes bacterium]
VLNSDVAAEVIVDRRREMAETLDVAPLTLENLYNAVDQNNGSLRVHALTDKILADSQYSKEVCNLMHLRQLGCSTGTLQDYGPDFGLTYVLDGLSAMGQ